nr:hypothetical protein [Leifsonia poae]
MSPETDTNGDGGAGDEHAGDRNGTGLPGEARPSAEGAARLSGFAAQLADSAGQPWAGRRFEETSFGDDDGTAPLALLGVLAAFRAGECGAEAVVDEVRRSRLLVPLVAELGRAIQTSAVT